MGYEASVILEIPIYKNKDRDFLIALDDLRKVILPNGQVIIAAVTTNKEQCRIPFPGYDAYHTTGKPLPTMRYFGVTLFVSGEPDKEMIYSAHRFRLEHGAQVVWCGYTIPYGQNEQEERVGVEVLTPKTKEAT